VDKTWIFLSIGGVGFFFFGMKTMSEGLKKVAGERLKAILHMVTKVPIVGVMVGMLVTFLIQSSGATTVMVVGFVNAGLLVLKQAISVILGANIGTTITAWIVSSMSLFKVTQYALPAVGIGFAMSTFCKTKRAKSWGEVLLGFGMLFVGLSFMKDAFAPLQGSEKAKEIFVLLSARPMLGVLVGILFTFLLHSSSATIAITQVLAFNGLISFEATIPLILGDNIGSTTTGQMAAIGTGINSRRAAMAHTIFNTIGVAYMLVFVYTGWYAKAINFIIPGELTQNNIMFHIAVAHSVFNIFNTIIFLPLIGWLERMSIWLVPKRKGEIDLGPQYLEKHLLDTPTLAMEQAKNESIYMLKVASKAVHAAAHSFINGDIKEIASIKKYEDATDNLQSEITQYLIDLSQRELSIEESEELPVWIHNVNDFERIGDHSQNIAELANRKNDENLPLSDDAVDEMNLMWNEISHMLEEASQALSKSDVDIAMKVLDREKCVNDLHEKFKKTHINRLNKGKCRLESGFVFLEFIDNMEKIGDRLTNVAQSVLGKMRWGAEYEKTTTQ